MNGLLLHPSTERQISQYLAKPSHALTLVGPTGSGKHSLALQLTSQLLAIPIDKVLTQAYVRMIVPSDGKALGIETIRELEHFLSLRVPSHKAIHRVVIIEDAQLLTNEAQNAFLKTLEEPPTGTVFILTSAHEQALLPTIRSRSPQIKINRPELQALQTFFNNTYVAQETQQALLLSGGLPGLAEAILADAEHPLRPATIKARELLGQTTFERLAHVDELARDRILALNTLFILQQMAHISLQTTQAAAAQRWRSIMTASYEAQELLLQSAQPKLVLTNLMLHL